MKKFLVIFTIFLLFFFLLGTTLLFIYRNQLLKGAERYVLPLVERRLGQRVEVSGLSLNVFPTYMDIKGVSIFYKNEEKEDKWVQIKEVKVFFSPWSLLTDTIIIKKIIVLEPELEILQFPAGTFNSLLRKEAPPLPLTSKKWTKDFVVFKIEVIGGKVLFNREDSSSVEIKGIDGTVRYGFIVENAYQVSFITKEVFISSPKVFVNIQKVEGDFSYQKDRFDIKRVKIVSIGSEMNLQGRVVGLEKPELDLAINGNLSLGEVDNYLRLKKALKGRLSLKGRMKGRYDDIVSEGELSLNGFSIDNLSIEQANGNFEGRLKEKVFSLDNINTRIFKGTVTGGITLSFPQAPFSYKAHLIVSQIDSEEVLRFFYKKFPFAGMMLDSDFQFTGEGFDPDRLKGSGWLKVKGKDSLLDLEGKISAGKRISFSVKGSSSNIKEITAPFGYSKADGTLDLTGELKGKWNNPVFDGRMVIKEGRIKEVNIPSLMAELRYSGGELVIPKASIIKGESLYKASGKITFKDKDNRYSIKNPYFQARAQITKGVPRDVVAVFYKYIPLYMTATGTLSFKGDLHNFSGEGMLDVSEGSVYGQTFDNGRVTAVLESNRILFPEVRAYRGKSTLIGKGFISFDGGFKAHITSTNINIQDINILRIKEKGLDIDSNFTLHLEGDGPMKRPRIMAKIASPQVFVKGNNLGKGFIDMSIKEGLFHLKGDLLDSSVMVSGEIGLNPLFPTKVILEVKEGRIDPIIAIFRPDLTPSLTVTATGRGDLAGSLKEPKGFSIDIKASRLKTDLAGYTVENEGDIRIHMANGELRIDSMRLKGEGTALELTGGMRPLVEYYLFINGEADLSLSNLFTKEIDYSKGKAYLAVMINGPWKDPEVRGGLTLEDGVIHSKSLSQRINNTRFVLLFNERQVILDSLEGEVGGGKVVASGRVILKGLSINNYGFSIDIADMKLRYPEGLSTLLSGNLFFQGDLQSRKLQGEVFVKKANYDKRIDLQSLILEFQKREKEPKGEVPVIGNTLLNIHFHGKDGLWINNNVAKVPFELDLFLKGTFERPLIFGRVEARQGIIYFRRNEFKVDSLVIDFVNPETIKPVFDIHAKTKVQRYTIDLSLSGTIDRFNLSLVSDPPLDETDILALLTVGQVTEEFAGKEGGIATTEATSFISDVFEQRVERAMRFDRFQVDPYYSSSTAASGARLTIGKRLLDDKLQVIYSTNLATSEEQLLLIEYILGKNISLIGERDEKGRVGADIKFRFEFR